MANLQTSFKKWHWKVGGRLFGFGTGPEADWKIIFISSTILVVLIIISSVFVFIKVYQGTVFTAEKSAVQEKKVLDIAFLRETVSYYQNKMLEFEKIKSVVAPSTDPSL